MRDENRIIDHLPPTHLEYQHCSDVTCLECDAEALAGIGSSKVLLGHLSSWHDLVLKQVVWIIINLRWSISDMLQAPILDTLVLAVDTKTCYYELCHPRANPPLFIYLFVTLIPGSSHLNNNMTWSTILARPYQVVRVVNPTDPYQKLVSTRIIGGATLDTLVSSSLSSMICIILRPLDTPVNRQILILSHDH